MRLDFFTIKNNFGEFRYASSKVIYCVVEKRCCFGFDHIFSTSYHTSIQECRMTAEKWRDPGSWFEIHMLPSIALNIKGSFHANDELYLIITDWSDTPLNDFDDIEVSGDVSSLLESIRESGLEDIIFSFVFCKRGELEPLGEKRSLPVLVSYSIQPNAPLLWEEKSQALKEKWQGCYTSKLKARRGDAIDRLVKKFNKILVGGEGAYR